MTHMNVSNARSRLGDLLDRVVHDGEHIVLERHGKKVAAIIPVEELHVLELIMQRVEDRQDKAEIRKAKRDIMRHGTVSWDELKKKLNL